MYGTDEERKQAIPYMYAVYMTAEEWKQYKLLNKIEE
jgi:hypothetical protein